MESDQTKIKEILSSKVAELKNLNNLDMYSIGSYVDILDENKNWCVGVILDRTGDLLTVHYEGCPSKFDEQVSIKSTYKISHFRSYSKGYTGFKKSAHRTYQFKLEDIREIENCLNLFTVNRFQVDLSPYEITQLIRGKIFTFIDIFMTYNYTAKEAPIAVPLVLDLLNKFIIFSIEYLNFYQNNIFIVNDFLIKSKDLYLLDNNCSILSALNEILLCLKRILGEEPRTGEFYKTHEDIIRKWQKSFQYKNKICIDKAYKSNTDHNKLPANLLSAMIDNFHEKKGFELIFNIILDSPSIEIIEPFVTFLHNFKVIIDVKTTFVNEIAQLKTLFNNKVNNLNENEVKEIKKNNLIYCLRNFCNLLDMRQGKIIFEDLYLTYYYKCLISKNLEKRIQGITAINLIIETVDRKESISSFSFSQNKLEMDENIETLDSKALLSFFANRNFIEVLLGENIHEEIIKRSFTFFKLLATKNSTILNISHDVYNLLWKNYIEKHESIAIQIETMMCDLSAYIPEKDKQYLFSKIRSHAVNNNKMIILIKKFTESCLRSNSLNLNFHSADSVKFFTDERIYGLPLLWNYMQNETYADADVHEPNQIIELCVNSITELMEISNVDDYLKEKVITLCLDNIKKGSSVIQSINLIRKIILDFHNILSKRIVKRMDESYNLINLIIKDLQRYILKVRSSYSDYTSLNEVYEEFYNHKANIESRLDFLVFFCCASKDRGKLTLTNEHVKQIWDLLHTKNTEMNNLFFEILRRNCDNLEEDIVVYIFTQLMCSKDCNDFTNLSIIGYNCFEKYFNNSNYHKNNMLFDGRSFRVASDDITGIDKLFEILCVVKHDIVRDKFAGLLTRLCTDLKIYTENFTTNYWKKFMNKLFYSFTESYTQKNENAIKGILSIFKNLLNNIGHPGEIPNQDDVTFYREGLDYTFVYNGESRNIKVEYKENTFHVRVRVAFYFDIPINNLVLKSKQRIIDMSDDFTTFKEMCHSANAIEVIERQHPILNLKNNPRMLLMNNEKLVIILYELLHNSEDVYIQDVWELINFLPKYSELEEEIGSLGKISISSYDCKKYFDDNSIYVMSYSLKIVKRFICGEDVKDVKDNSINTEWISILIKNKVHLNLLQLIFGFKIEHFVFNLGYECVIDLLFILKNILIVWRESPSIEFVKQLIELINLIIKSAIVKDSDTKLVDIQKKYKRIKDREQVDEAGAWTVTHPDSNEYCVDILRLWSIQDEAVQNIIQFIYYFKIFENVFKVFLNEKNLLKELITVGFICPKNFKFKESLQVFFSELLLQGDKFNFKHILFDYILNFETLKLANDYKETCGEYFKITAKLLDEYLPNFLDDNEYQSKFILLAENMIEYIINSEEENDTILEGYLNILRVFILKSAQISQSLIKKYNLIDLVLNKCLFSKCVIQSAFAPFPKCKSPSAKFSAYRLISAISYNNPTTMKEIITQLNQTHVLGFWKSKKLIDWKISLTQDEKSSTNYIGLKNLGCTCYMNSLIQQLYMIPPLRESLLACPDNHLGPTESSSLFQLKNIFAFLKAFDGKYYNPKDFCLNFDGVTLDIREQMDVDEFYNTMIDKIENHLKNTEYQNIFKHFFGFTISDEFICKGCPHNKEKNVFFNSIQLQVLNKKSIIESLKSYVEGELLEGDNAYHCEPCDRKVNALKRQSIKNLPRFLIIVLKRFEFDYETMMKIKVNDYCEFPLELNMEQFTQDYLSGGSVSKPSDYYMYNLTGTIIHTGTSESGHYYSIIKDKDCWYEFNDINVKNYDINDLSNEAFGGTEVIFNRENKKETVEKNTNAYLLFYERKYKDQDADEATNIYKENALNKFSNIPSIILDRIHTENFQYWISKIVFSREYHAFITDLLINSNMHDQTIVNYLSKNDNFEIFDTSNDLKRSYHNKTPTNIDLGMLINPNPSNDYIIVNNKEEQFLFKFAINFFLNVLIRSKERYYQPAMMDILKSYINKENCNAEWLLEEFSNWELITEYLIECPIIEMRKLVVGLLYAGMIKCYKTHFSNKSETMSNLSNLSSMSTLTGVSNISPVLAHFINNTISYSFKFTGRKDMSFINFLLYRFSLIGDECKLHLINLGLLHYLTCVYSERAVKDSMTSNQDSSHSSIYDTVNKKLTLNLSYINPPHLELNQKLMNKVERLSAFEETIEKKHSEKLQSNKEEYSLLLVFCEMIKICNVNSQIERTRFLYDINTDGELRKYLDFTENGFIAILISEVQSKSAAISFSNMMINICHSNIEHSKAFMKILLDLIRNMDSYELEYIMIIFKRYLLRIDDSLKESRIKSTLTKYLAIVFENNKYWSFVDYNIDFFINMCKNNSEIMKNHIESVNDYIIKFVKYLKENPSPPTLIPSKTLSMYKKKSVMYPKNISQGYINNFTLRHTNNSNEKINQLRMIYNKQFLAKNGYDSDIDLTDFKFFVGDKVKFENTNAVVINVLDEMINIEYDKNEINGTKRPPTQWVDTNNKNLNLVQLINGLNEFDDITMEVDRQNVGSKS